MVGAHNVSSMVADVMNSTMSMMMSNASSMGHGMMNHGMHNMSLGNVTGAAGMHGHLGHDTATDAPMHHHGAEMTVSGMGHNHAGMTGDGMIHNHGGVTGGGMDHNHGADHSVHDMAGHNMLMFFNFQLPIHVLFLGWEVTSQGQLAGACIAWCVLAIVYEGLKSLREYILFRKRGSERKYLIKPKMNGNADETDVRQGDPSCLRKLFDAWHILLSLLQIVQTTLGMFLMLVYMTFNVWLAFSVSLGSGLGYWLFACNKRSGDFNDGHCV